VILEGVDGEEAREALYSTIHGAGRVMSRTQAAGKRTWIQGRMVRVGGGLIDWDAARRDLKDRGIVLVGGGADEAPGVYKRLATVLRYHTRSVRVLHTLEPIGVAMAGEEIEDPYRD
jgi:tRNA-splicing ligase RtcB